MIHRKSGVFKTSYIADMAVFPLPIAQWTVAALTAMFVVVVRSATAR
jgi:branched-chain amino acid transport system permease protein